MGSMIRDGLWLGGLDDACNTSQLLKQGITHILTVEFRPLPTNNQKDFSYKYIHAEDMPDQDLISHFQDCFTFIDEGLTSRLDEGSAGSDARGGVLVHCYVGYSRSATIVIAYIMQKEGLSYEKAFESVYQLRSVGPNPGFTHQLQLFEKMGCALDKKHPEFRSFCLNNITGKIRELSFVRATETEPFENEVAEDVALNNALASDPMQHPLTTDNVVFKCRKCRRPLARGSSSVVHLHGRGKAFPETPPPRGQKKSLCEVKDVECTMGLFIEPVEWMKDQILMLEGKLSCPKCKAKIGNFSWVGQNCPCGRWMVPAFHLAQNKIDKEVKSPPGS